MPLPGSNMIKVVVADDEDSVRALLGITLVMEGGFEVVGEAHDGAEAIDMVDHRHPDAVVLDLMMPNVSGMDAIGPIKTCWPRAKIVVFSALSADQAADEAFSKGADGYVEKTKFTTELSDTLHRLCDCAVA